VKNTRCGYGFPVCGLHMYSALIVGVFYSVTCFAAETMWDLLAREEPALGVMKLDKVAAGLQIYGAWSTRSDGPAGMLPTVRRQLSVIHVDQQERVTWRHIYSSFLPVDQIVPWNTNQYLLLYKLGSRLLKVNVPDHGHHGS
jgi:hypothetical protein